MTKRAWGRSVQNEPEDHAEPTARSKDIPSEYRITGSHIACNNRLSVLCNISSNYCNMCHIIIIIVFLYAVSIRIYFCLFFVCAAIYNLKITEEIICQYKLLYWHLISFSHLHPRMNNDKKLAKAFFILREGGGTLCARNSVTNKNSSLAIETFFDWSYADR